MQKTFGPKNFNPQGSFTQPANQSNESDFISREADLAKREGILEERERQISEKQKLIEDKLDQLDKTRKDLIENLQKSAHISVDEAKQLLLENVEKDLKVEISKRIRSAEEEIKFEADEKARHILAEAMLHGVTDYVAEFTTSRVALPDEEVKGRIIGKEGRNIRTFEQATGVEVLMDDDTPNVLIVSSFDPVRREIARISLDKLIADGRIQPQRIEEIVTQVTGDLEKVMYQAGEKLCHDTEVYNLPRDVVATLGRFKYRYSYGQNLIEHSIEVSQIAAELARQIGANVNIAKVGGLLHDIGKVVYEGDEGTHVEKGVQFAKQHGLPEEIINAIAEHHEDKPFSSVESILVAIADAISGGRPGARRENVQDYIKRMTDIERIAASFEGVDRAFALQAGREVRVIVIPDRVTDDEMPKLVHDILGRISKEVMVPGAVKVTAIRETRFADSILTSTQ